MDQFKPSKELRENILFQIVKEEGRRAKNYLLVSFITTTASIVGVIFSAQYVMQAVYQSSFYRYLSLLISDSDIVLSYWQQFTLSLVESMPFFAVTLALVAIVILMVSIRVFTNNARRSFNFSFN